MLIVVFASVAMPVSITAPPAVVNRNEDAGREEEQTNECEDDQTDETYSVTSHDSSPRRKRRWFSASVAQENAATYWTFALCLELSGFVDTFPRPARRPRAARPRSRTPPPAS
jgi:hypothetical protein